MATTTGDRELRPAPATRRTHLMTRLARRPRWQVAAMAALVCSAAALPLWQQRSARAVEDPTEPVTGNSTHFFGLGGPYGGCGMTEDALETLDYIALNVYDTPQDYVYYTRPMPEGDSKIGMWDNGHNCGRWVQVTIGDYCTGFNDGNQYEDFCKKGEWISDEYNGATLKMLVADSCGDGNAWCRDDPYHIDLHDESINRFVLDGSEVGDLLPEHWNNRLVSWEFIEAPDYSGDIKIGFMQGAQTWWAAVAVSHLANGIHGVESWSGGEWVDAEMNGDMGQSWVLKPYEPGGTTFSIRVRDVNDEYVNDGRVYTFSLPEDCDTQCLDPYEQVEYTTSAEAPTADPSATPTGTCSATASAVNSWPDGYQAQVTVTAETRISGWRVTWTPASDQTVDDVWDGIREDDGSTVSVRNASWNGALAAGASATFGFTVEGSTSVPAALTCVAS